LDVEKLQYGEVNEKWCSVGTRSNASLGEECSTENERNASINDCCDGRRPGQPKVSSDEERDRMTRDRLNAIEEET
jgi:hypothetical protein